MTWRPLGSRDGRLRVALALLVFGCTLCAVIGGLLWTAHSGPTLPMRRGVVFWYGDGGCMEDDVGFAWDGRYLGWPSLIDLRYWLNEPFDMGGLLDLRNPKFSHTWLTPEQQTHVWALRLASEMSHHHNDFNHPGLYDESSWSRGEVPLAMYDCVQLTPLVSINGVVGSLVREFRAPDRTLFASARGVEWVSRVDGDRSKWNRHGTLYTTPQFILVDKDGDGIEKEYDWDWRVAFGWNKELTLHYILHNRPAAGDAEMSP